MDHATMADWYYDESRDDRNEGFHEGDSLGAEPDDEPTPLELLRSTGPHAGLATLSAELWDAWLALPRPERTALACRDTHPGMGEEPLAIAVALALGGSYVEAHKTALEALEKTRGILDHINGKVTR